MYGLSSVAAAVAAAQTPPLYGQTSPMYGMPPPLTPPLYGISPHTKFGHSFYSSELSHVPWFVFI